MTTTILEFLLWLGRGMVALLDTRLNRWAESLERAAHPIEHAGYVLYLDTMAEHGQRDIALNYPAWLLTDHDAPHPPEQPVYQQMVGRGLRHAPVNPRRTMPIDTAEMTLCFHHMASSVQQLRSVSLNKLEALASQSLGPVDPRLIGRIGSRAVFSHHGQLPGMIRRDQTVLLDMYRRVRA